MHVRINKVKSGRNVYKYTQLVQSYRRPDGKTAQRVIANLGELAPTETENIRVALEASRRKQALVIGDDCVDKRREAIKPKANLRYLDLAVLLEIWNKWGVGALIDELMPIGDALIQPSALVAALSLQRCLEPTPKYEVPRWVESTALPELLHLQPEHINNTRLHRVLDELDQVSPALMRKLPRLYQDRQGAFAALFVDVTDAWFVGHGPAIAERAKTKEGRFERKINILLLCNEKGYPIRWETFAGRTHDSESILALFESIRGLSWVGQTPIVCDRALGSTAHLIRLLATGLPFLTAITRNEFASYATIPAPQDLLDFELPDKQELTQQELADAAARAAEIVGRAGLHQLDSSLLFSDEGVVELPGQQVAPVEQAASSDKQDHKTVRAIKLGRKLRRDLEQQRATTYNGAGKPYGLTKEQVSRYLRMMRLTEDLQEAVLGGEATALSENDLIRVAKIDEPDQQRAEFTRLVEHRTNHPDRRASRHVAPASKPKRQQPNEPLKVRAVIYFNPLMFVRQRMAARKAISQLTQYVAEQNRRLKKPQSRRQPPAITADVMAELRKRELTTVYDIRIQTISGEGKDRYQIELEQKPEAWRARRALDGFSILVGHTRLPHRAEELCQLYRAKNAVEHDFRIIKSVVKLRPVYHRLESKIRAHVTICMLSLLLERTLDAKLKAVRAPFTSASALGHLEDCRLNLYGGSNSQPAFYTTTTTTPEQNAVLRALRLKQLADDREVADRISPR